MSTSRLRPESSNRHNEAKRKVQSTGYFFFSGQLSINKQLLSLSVNHKKLQMHYFLLQQEIESINKNDCTLKQYRDNVNLTLI